MRVSHVLLGLIATVSAIDIRGFPADQHCKGTYTACTNASPNDCCVSASGNVYGSIGFYAIPKNWNIITRAYNGGSCKNEKFSAQSEGRDTICLGGSAYSGGKYAFTQTKRSDDADAATGDCNVRRPDLMVFEDGKKYNMTSLDNDLYTELVSIKNARLAVYSKSQIC